MKLWIFYKIEFWSWVLILTMLVEKNAVQQNKKAKDFWEDKIQCHRHSPPPPGFQFSSFMLWHPLSQASPRAWGPWVGTADRRRQEKEGWMKPHGKKEQDRWEPVWREYRANREGKTAHVPEGLLAECYCFYLGLSPVPVETQSSLRDPNTSHCVPLVVFTKVHLALANSTVAGS